MFLLVSGQTDQQMIRADPVSRWLERKRTDASKYPEFGGA
jgi:hypothetical protein